MAGTDVQPFRIQIPQAELDDLRDRLRRTRWPDAETVADWSQGVPRAWLRELCEHWATAYDWRATEAWLNSLPHFRTEIDGLGIHFLHVRSPHEHATPLILSHGWPGSFLEFRKVIEPLTRPEDPADAFHVVCPSLPGYAFSDKPAEPGWHVARIADAWAELMRRLGYERFGAAGSDWGTSISTLLGARHPERLVGIHLVPPLAAPSEPADDFERAALRDLDERRRTGGAYADLHATRPQTVGYALNDSPAGLCAWIAEKYVEWTDGDVVTRDELLDSVTLYWLTGSAASSARLYWESFRIVEGWFTGATDDTIDVPAGCSIFPKEVPRASRRWAQRRFTDIRHFNVLERGGHFAALEQPELFVAELRAFFRLAAAG